MVVVRPLSLFIHTSAISLVSHGYLTFVGFHILAWHMLQLLL